jgi:DNA polymerase-3 subunit epsilon
MNLRELLGFGDAGSVPLTETQLMRLAVWRDRAPADTETVHGQQRYVVVDVEASGLDLVDDRLLAIGAVAVDRALISGSDIFSVALASDLALPKILPAEALARVQAPVPPAEALLGFLEFSRRSVLVAHRSEFPQAMLSAAIRSHLGVAFEPVWVDLAYVLPTLFEDGPDVTASLGAWLDHFAIGNVCPHNALADSLAIARLLQRVIARATREGYPGAEALREIERTRRRVQRLL